VPAAPAPSLDVFLAAWLGRWPAPSGTVEVVGAERRTQPAWDGRPAPLTGVLTPDGGVVSVAPDRVGAVAAVLDGLDVAGVRERRAELAEAVGAPGGRVIDGIFRWTAHPTALEDAGEWVDTGDPVIPAWLKPFGGDALVTVEGGKVVAGVGLKRHDPAGQEVAVVTEEEARGRGLARRLVSQAARRVVEGGGVVVYLHAPDTVASARVAEASGFPDAGWRILGLIPPPSGPRRSAGQVSRAASHR
jgi:GNAT superfamily N-acetyltransferase